MFAVKGYVRGSTPAARPCHRRHLGRDRAPLKLMSWSRPFDDPIPLPKGPPSPAPEARRAAALARM
jgi:hypothetical protein